MRVLNDIALVMVQLGQLSLGCDGCPLLDDSGLPVGTKKDEIDEKRDGVRFDTVESWWVRRQDENDDLMYFRMKK